MPHGYWETITVTAGLCVGGIAAPMVIDGAMDGSSFRAYVARSTRTEIDPEPAVMRLARRDASPIHQRPPWR